MWFNDLPVAWSQGVGLRRQCLHRNPAMIMAWRSTVADAATTATAATVGSAERFVSSTAVKRGDMGAPILQSVFTYFVHARYKNSVR